MATSSGRDSLSHASRREFIPSRSVAFKSELGRRIRTISERQRVLAYIRGVNPPCFFVKSAPSSIASITTGRLLSRIDTDSFLSASMKLFGKLPKRRLLFDKGLLFAVANFGSSLPSGILILPQDLCKMVI